MEGDKDLGTERDPLFKHVYKEQDAAREDAKFFSERYGKEVTMKIVPGGFKLCYTDEDVEA